MARMQITATRKSLQVSSYCAVELFLVLLLAVLNGYASAQSGIPADRRKTSAARPAPPTFREHRDPPIKLAGERLFKETRFAQFFASHMQQSNVNLPATARDPLMEVVKVPRFPGGEVPNPYRGRSMNCRTCHFVEELSQTVTPVGSRSYADFAPRSRIPVREDGQLTTVRNSSNIVDSLIAPRASRFLHRDGEFTSATALVVSTLTGRNFGWLPGESGKARAHIARVIREDDGTGPLAKSYGAVSYAKLLLGEAPELSANSALLAESPDRVLPAEFRIDVTKATDKQIVDAVARIMAAYMETLTFSRDHDDRYNGSPYDLFLQKNDLPAKPAAGETDLQYSQRLLHQLELLAEPKWVGPKDGYFKYFIDQQFAFTQRELEGLKIFLRLSPRITKAAALRGSRPATLLYLTFLPGLGLVWLGLFRARRHNGTAVAAPLAALGAFILAFAGAASVLRATEINRDLPPSSHAGNCAQCHTPPHFTDFKFHNTGATQDEYDAVHGAGAFARLAIPGYGQRKRNPNAFLPVTPRHPAASGVFRSAPDALDLRKIDLGMWNVYGNDDFPEPQRPMRALMCRPGSSCDPEQILPRTIARFKTPTVRDLGQCDPYLHSGEMRTIEDVLVFYQRVSALARLGKLRNGDPAIAGIALDDLDVVYVAAFLRSLNEDYE